MMVALPPAAARTVVMPDEVFPSLLPWVIGLMAFICVGTALILLVRRWLQRGAPSAGDSFTLQDLRQLHARGELSDEEFQRARSLIIGQLQPSSRSQPAHAEPTENETPQDRSSN